MAFHTSVCPTSLCPTTQYVHGKVVAWGFSISPKEDKMKRRKREEEMTGYSLSPITNRLFLPHN